MKILIPVAIAFVLLGVYYASLTFGVPFAPSISTTTPSGSPKDATYEIDNVRVQLVRGEANVEIAPGSASRTVTKYFGNEVSGDFNKDGLDDVAFLLTRQGGGSGLFYYVAVALKTAYGYKGTNAILLGDRIAPQTTEYRLGKIIVNYADRNPGEPMTERPSLGVSKYFVVNGDSLVVSD